jgi:hypothetical protein
MKIRVDNLWRLHIDLSQFDREESNYAFDQFLDRYFDTPPDDDIEVEFDYENQKMITTIPILEILQKAIEEKENDIEWERKRGYRE